LPDKLKSDLGVGKGKNRPHDLRVSGRADVWYQVYEWDGWHEAPKQRVRHAAVVGRSIRTLKHEQPQEEADPKVRPAKPREKTARATQGSLAVPNATWPCDFPEKKKNAEPRGGGVKKTACGRQHYPPTQNKAGRVRRHFSGVTRWKSIKKRETGGWAYPTSARVAIRTLSDDKRERKGKTDTSDKRGGGS